MRASTVALTIGLMLSLPGIPAVALADQAIPFEVLARGEAPWEANERLVVMRDADDLARQWRESHLGEPIPVVNFQRDMLLAYFMGRSPNTSYWAEVTQITRSHGSITVHVIGSHGGGGDAIVYPYVLLRLHKWPGDVVVVREDRPSP